MLTMETCLQPAADLQVHQEFDTVFLIPRQQRPLRLNESGSRIWQLVAAAVSVLDIVRRYAAGAGLPVDECTPEVMRFLDRMTERGYLVPRTAPSRLRPSSTFRPAYEARTPAFFAECWRKKPCHMPGLLDATFLERFTEAEYLSWCRQPAKARLYHRIEAERPGGTRALVFDDAQHAPAHYDRTRTTLLLNGVERVSSDLRAVRRSFGPAYHWRYDDVVATLSPVGSGIGFHAGHEDGFLVQLRGSREWRLWWPDVLSEEYKRSLLGDDTVAATDPPRPDRAPDFVFHLEAGDALYLPVFMGHEGITTADSIALSIGWAGLSPARLLRRMGRLDARVREHASDFYRLLPDPAPDAMNVAEFLHDAVRPTFAHLEDLDEAEVASFLRAVASGEGA